MSIFVNTNVTSLQGQRYLNNVNNQLNTTYQRLSSGLRINSAKDDAAGLLIADRLTTQINGLSQGNRNASDGIALLQTMEGGMDEISNMLQRVRTLAVQSANGTLTSDDRAAISQEAHQLAEEIDRIASQTTYGGKTILKGHQTDSSSIFSSGTAGNYTAGNTGGNPAATGKFSLQIGANNGDSLDFEIKSFTMKDLLLAADFKLEKDGTNSVGEKANSSDTITVAGGATGNAFGFRITAASDAVTKVSFALSEQEQAKKAIESIDKLLNVVDTQRSEIGAYQNRLESSIRNQSNVAANSSDARARIRDTDFAAESAALSQQNIIQQAATSMLMQANMRPQLGLSLLG